MNRPDQRTNAQLSETQAVTPTPEDLTESISNPRLSRDAFLRGLAVITTLPLVLDACAGTSTFTEAIKLETKDAADKTIGVYQKLLTSPIIANGLYKYEIAETLTTAALYRDPTTAIQTYTTLKDRNDFGIGIKPSDLQLATLADVAVFTTPLDLETSVENTVSNFKQIYDHLGKYYNLGSVFFSDQVNLAVGLTSLLNIPEMTIDKMLAIVDKLDKFAPITDGTTQNAIEDATDPFILARVLEQTTTGNTSNQHLSDIARQLQNQLKFAPEDLSNLSNLVLAVALADDNTQGIIDTFNSMPDVGVTPSIPTTLTLASTFQGFTPNQLIAMYTYMKNHPEVQNIGGGAITVDPRAANLVLVTTLYRKTLPPFLANISSQLLGDLLNAVAIDLTLSLLN